MFDRARRRYGALLVIAFAALATSATLQSTLHAAPSSTAPARPDTATLLVLGDSISAEYGLPRDTGWVKRMDTRLRAQGYSYRVLNASISGETTSGGLARLDALLTQEHPAIVVVELGGNDGLRGLSLAGTTENLDAIITRSQKAGASVVVVGMQLPPNYGKAYTDRFAAIYADVAKRHRAALVPFLFEGFGDRYELFQADRIHPTQAAQDRLLDNVWPILRPLLKRR